MSKKKIFIALIAIIILGIGGYFGYQQYSQSAGAQKAKAQREVKNTIEAVSRLINLPEGDNPEVAIVSDLKPLADQPFFRNASIGDRVIVYPNIGRAILYNPKLDKIMEIATLQAPAAPRATAAATATTKPATQTTTSSTPKK